MHRLLLLFLIVFAYELRPAVADGGDTVAGSVEIYALLDEPFSCDFKEKISLGEALKHVHETTKVSIFIDHPALRELGVSLESRVKFRLPFQLSLRDALDYLVKQHGLTWTVKNEMLNITSAEKANGERFQKVYYVGDLLGATPKDVQSGQPVDFEPLMDYIATMVAKESWNDGGGSIAEYYPNLSLVVRQREEQHAEIAKLLGGLRKFAASRSAGVPAQ